jgi:hypothetical protein
VEPLEVSRREVELSRVSGIQGVHHSLEERQIHEFGEDIRYLSTWVVLALALSTVWHI